jgi:hypothetical protein
VLCGSAALFYYSFLYLICRRGCCFSVLFHRRDEVYFETKTIFFSRDFAAARVLTQLITAGLSFYAAQPQNFALPNQTEAGGRSGRAFAPGFTGAFRLRLGPRADYGIFQCCRAEEMF